MPLVEVTLDVEAPTTLSAELRVSHQPKNHTPDETLESLDLKLVPGQGQKVPLPFDAAIDQPRYAFVCLMANPHVVVWLSDQRVTGVLSLTHQANRAVARAARQEPPPDSGLESFEFWIPKRRPNGKNFAIRIEPPIKVFGPANLVNGLARPTRQPNAWVAAPDDASPWVTLCWAEPQTIERVELVFDTDYDHPLESVLLGHPERVMPFCVPEVVIRDGRAVLSAECTVRSADCGSIGVVECWSGGVLETPILQHSSTPILRHSVLHPPAALPVLARLTDNHQSRRTIRFENPVTTDRLVICLTPPAKNIPAALFEVRCYGR